MSMALDVDIERTLPQIGQATATPFALAEPPFRLVAVTYTRVSQTLHGTVSQNGAPFRAGPSDARKRARDSVLPRGYASQYCKNGKRMTNRL